MCVVGRERQKADAARRRFAHVDGDHLTMLAVWEAYQKVKKPEPQPGGDPESLTRAVRRAMEGPWRCVVVPRELHQHALHEERGRDS